MNERTEWQALIGKIPWVKAMPFHLTQDMSNLLFEQLYLPNEVVYDVGDKACDTVYFIVKGRIKVQARVTIEQQLVIPTGTRSWVRKIQHTEVHYFVKQISEGQFFGLEELVEIGLRKLNGEDSSGICRNLRMTTIENCTLLYLPIKSFLRLFGENELNKLRDFCEAVDLKEIQKKVQSTWKFKKMMSKQVLNAAIQSNGQNTNRLLPWVKKVKSKVTTSPEIKIEESRIEVLNVREVSYFN
jgi:CRP-like cAMP-binding protein